MTIRVVIVHEHYEDTFVPLDKKCWRTVGYFFRNTRHCGANSTDALELGFSPSFASFVPFLPLCQLLRAELRDASDQIYRDRLRERKPNCTFAEVIVLEFIFERRN